MCPNRPHPLDHQSESKRYMTNSLMPQSSFLQSSFSTVMLKEEDALREQGVATLSCLLSGLKVFDTSYDDQQRLLRLVKGIHGFHVYATEYWTEYLLANAATHVGLEGSDKLLDLAIRLADALDDMTTNAPPPLKASSVGIDDRLSFLAKHGTVKEHVERALLARSQKRLELELLRDSRT
jgi:hypothetical protein